MKEVLTKNFWLGVKKTFNDALEGRPADAAPEDSSKNTPAPDVPPSPPATSDPKL